MESKQTGDWDGRAIRLTALPDGTRLDPPWEYGNDPKASLGLTRFQLLSVASMSNEELGRRIRFTFGDDGRDTLLDITALTPTYPPKMG